MTLISFFDRDPLDNIGDILFFRPEVCIFVGETDFVDNKARRGISQFLAGRNMDIRVEYYSVPQGDIDSAKGRLERILAEHPQAVLDVSGGTEMLIALAGSVADRLGVPMYQRKGQSNRLLWQSDCNLQPMPAALTVREVVMLHCATILDAKAPPAKDDPLFRHIPKLWEIGRKAPSDYNHLSTALANLTANSRTDDPLELYATKEELKRCPGHINDFLLREMAAEGLIHRLRMDSKALSFRFCSSGLREILTKAGNLLEEVTCLAASTFANDSAMGISMDWDGKVTGHGGSNTKNELDVMLTVGLQPTCISCKNGNIDNNALYELDTVSRHFGGRFAKRILVASYVNHNSQSAQHLRQRALDMDIIPLFDAHSYSFQEFTRELEKFCV